MRLLTVDPQVAEEKTKEVVNRFQHLYPSMTDFLVNLVIMLVIFVVCTRLINIGIRMLKKVLVKIHMEAGAMKFLLSLIRVTAYVVLVLILSERIGISSASILAVLGSAGLAIGLALQGSLSNFAGGVLLLTVKPFVVGDYVITPQAEGTVKEIGMIYTTLITLDNKKVTIPNGSLSNGVITNVTAMKERRLEIVIELDYDADIEAARQIILGLIDKSTFVIKEKETRIYIDNLQKTGVMMGMRCWCATGDYAFLKWEILEGIKNEFATHGILLARIRQL